MRSPMLRKAMVILTLSCMLLALIHPSPRALAQDNQATLALPRLADAAEAGAPGQADTAPAGVDAASPSSPEIVGGWEADPGEWPWQVWLIVQMAEGMSACGGSLIQSRWVLTAAHCVYDEFTGEYVPPVAVEVVLGEHDLTVYEGSEQVRGVIQVAGHPAYTPASFDNDLALLKLDLPATLNGRVAYVPLATSPADDELAEPDDLVTVTGWGTTAPGGNLSDVLMELTLPLVSNTKCGMKYLGMTITPNMICFGLANGGQSACQGDSGGPWVVPDGNDGWKQVGVVSFGRERCNRSYAVGMRVARFMDWIQQYVASAPPLLTVDEFTSTRGHVGAIIQINGSGFLDVTEVLFSGVTDAGASANAVAADYTVQSDRVIIATVPVGASSGPITVKTAHASATSPTEFIVVYSLAVTHRGNGEVTSSPSGIDCGASCTAEYNSDTAVTLTAQPGVDSIFTGWDGACWGLEAECDLTVRADQSVTATFVLKTESFAVSVGTDGEGDGTITSDPAGIACGDDCAQEYRAGTVITLTATPDPGSEFDGWRGACMGNVATCEVAVVAATSVTAAFTVELQGVYLPSILR